MWDAEMLKVLLETKRARRQLAEHFGKTCRRRRYRGRPDVRRWVAEMNRQLCAIEEKWPAARQSVSGYVTIHGQRALSLAMMAAERVAAIVNSAPDCRERDPGSVTRADGCHAESGERL